MHKRSNGHRSREPCTKKKYPSYGAALRKLLSMNSERGEIRIYRCGKHNRQTYHLTSKVRR